MNFRANFVRIGVNSATQIILMTVPKNEAPVATKIVRPALPFSARGYPSMAVAAEAGVPGMFRRMALWFPPEIAPM